MKNNIWACRVFLSYLDFFIMVDCAFPYLSYFSIPLVLVATIFSLLCFERE